jgi:arylsulfatase A-like enzyme
VNDTTIAVIVRTDSPQTNNEPESTPNATPARPDPNRESEPKQKRQVVPSRTLLLRDLLAILLAIALTAGLIEATYWTVSRLVFGRITFLPLAGIWLTPLAYLVQFTFVLLPIIAWGVVFRRPTAVVWALAIATFCGVFTQLLVVGHLSPLAQVMLAAGAATVAVRSFQRHTVTWMKCLQSIAVVSTAALLCAIVIERGMAAWHEQRALAALPAVSSTPNPPNVLLIVLDTVRADCLGISGACPSPSPRIDAFAERGFNFSQASATAPWTLPSTASMFTGRLPHETSTGWHAPLNDEPTTLAEVLSQQGYETAGFVANAYCASETGLARGFLHYDDFSKSLGILMRCTAAGRRLVLSDIPLRLGVHLAPGRRSAHEINTAFLNWTEQRSSRPFFAFLNYMDAHDPYLARSPFDDRRPQTMDDRRLIEFWWWIHKDGVTSTQTDYLRSSYVDCIRYLDSQVGDLLSELEDRHVLQDTWVIITSDHGEHFGDHDLYGHGNSLYEAAIHVPLVIVPPGGRTGRRVDTPVSLQDLPATILEFAGAANAAIPGSPLLIHDDSAWKAAAASRDALFAEIDEPCFMPPCHGRSPVFRGVMRSVRCGQFKYIHIQDGSEELYDLAADPEETINLAQAPAYRATRDRLRSQLSTVISAGTTNSGDRATHDDTHRTSIHVNE